MTIVSLAKPLLSNGFTLSSAPDRLGRLEPTDPTRPRAALWEQFQASFQPSE